MSENLKDILSNINPEIDQETLLQYLQGHLTPEKQHELEEKMLESELESDALEGLAAFSDKQHLSHVVDQLNRELKKKTQARKQRREKMQLKQDPWLWMAVLLILLLIVISYMVIHFKLKH
jgi:tRNA(Met) C34 N-acetyltransferase TmcA